MISVCDIVFCVIDKNFKKIKKKSERFSFALKYLSHLHWCKWCKFVSALLSGPQYGINAEDKWINSASCKSVAVLRAQGGHQDIRPCNR